EVGPADERPAEPPPESLDQLGARAGEDVAHEGDVVDLRDLVPAVNLGVAGQRQPLSWRDPLGFEPGRTVALRGEDDVEAGGLLAAPVGVEVGVDRPPGARPEPGR